MGKGIVYCQGCGRSLRDDDFDRGRAQMLENHPWCAACRPVQAPKGKSSPRIPKVAGAPPSTRKVAAPPPAPASRTPILVGGALAGAALLILVVVLLAGGKGAPEPAAAPAARPDPGLEQEFRELERFAASATDPDAILARCARARAKLRGTPLESRVHEFEEKARAIQDLRDAGRRAGDLLAQAEALRKSDPEFEKREDVVALYRKAAADPGGRRAEAERLRADYEKAHEAWKAETRDLPPAGHRASHCYQNDAVAALSDGRAPSSSGDHSIPRLTFWDHKGTSEWVTWDFGRLRTVKSFSVYWFDDTGKGHCRLPASWKLSQLEGGAWKEVKGASGYGVAANRFNTATFEPVRTGALRLDLRLQAGWSGGILECRVEE